MATVIEAAPREVLGKKVRFLRREGLIPANMYGRGKESVAVQIERHSFELMLKHGEVQGMLELMLDGKKHNVLIRRVDRLGGAGPVQHVDFYSVDLRRRITVDVPLHFEGEAPAVRELGATVPYALTSVNVECLPANIPQSIVVDLTSLARLEDVIFVRDLPVPEGVRILTDGDLPVASPVQTSAALAEADEAAVAAEAAEAEEEAAAEAEGETAKEE